VELRLNALFLYSIKKPAPAAAASQKINSVKRSPERTAPSNAAVSMSMMAKYRSEGLSFEPTKNTV